MRKFLKKSWFNIFIYGSLIFLCYYFIQNDILNWPKIYNPVLLIISLFFLLIGFFLEMFSLFKLLQVQEVVINFTTIIISSGASILGKYIPGKIWAIVGSAKIVSDYSKTSFSRISFISLEAQIIILWTGLVISFIGIVSSGIDVEYVLLTSLFLFLFSIIIFVQKYKLLVEKILFKLFKKEFALPKIRHKKGYILFLNFIPWISWTIGFYLLALSISNSSLPVSISYSFVISTTFGVITLFAPGGLGVREGIMIGYLTICGLDLSAATTIAVFSRLWFLTGELVIFIVGFILKIVKE